ncbi:MBL fold metallo-hydrolase [Synechococcus sp. PCC 7336]|uniref:MBL fold metallo-hydrolase n=1 Tax=Synechococcus sp. PCC 7336 TaxID=195250 RepID=UPI000346540E|nr:MBL fold metallo-hydrolase [Synechococcus sp. PCC 7336]
MLFRQMFDRETCTYTYLIADPNAKTAVLVDPVLEQVERDLQLLKELALTLLYCLETHIHADHITGTDRLRQTTGCQGCVPAGASAACADRHISDGEVLTVGAIAIEAISTPGHTDSHLAYRVNGERLLTGDALFVRGCGRTDFQSGDAGILYDSVTQRLFALPEETVVYPGHDYRGHTCSTIGEEKRWNPRFAGRTRSGFIDFMGQLDLPHPKKMMEAVPANELCGNLAVTA